MRFHEPSPLDRFFETPPDERPWLNLDITHNPDRWSDRLREINKGGSKWFDLVMGTVLDEAKRHDIEPHIVNAALAAGNLIGHAYFVPLNPDAELSVVVPEEHAAYVGAIEAFSSMLIIAGGKPSAPKTSIQYVRPYEKKSDYKPFHAQEVHTNARSNLLTVGSTDITNQFVQRPVRPQGRKELPKELHAANILGKYADAVMSGLDEGTMVAYAKVRL